jgi:DNA repair protein RadA/Sms
LAARGSTAATGLMSPRSRNHMNKKSSTVYVCNNCGEDFAKWLGRCTNCGAWETITEMRGVKATPSSRAIASGPAEVVEFAECKVDESGRITGSFPEIDRVLGGGLIPGAFILLGGDPGIGKSTLLLQLLASWAGKGRQTLYISGEESTEQIYLRASRLGVSAAPVRMLTETSVETILNKLSETKPGIVVVDSIQTLFSEALESAPGSVAQVRESASMLLRFAKQNTTAVILIGHVTKDGSIAGPRVLEHMVDTVLYFEGDSHYQHRIVRAVKNRYGPSGEIAILSMTDRGLKEITNPSEFFLLNRANPQVGTAVVPVLEGSRVLVVEVQSLVNKSHFGLPQRVASGINPKKLALLLAVLERFGGFGLGEHDIFFNIAGGLIVAEPAVDLGVAASIISSFSNRALRRDLAFIGELGLGGEIRPVNNMPLRIKELSRMGFSHCLVPRPPKNADWVGGVSGINLVECGKISEVKEFVF